jgi:EAL domain-containing protein (putative c-di-GMP-specific phosphodiesterase class I)
VSVDAGFVFELDKAITENELVLHYQPIVRMSDRKPVAAEALVRWRHPTRGVLPPSQFVPAIERAGLARELSLWVLREAIMQSSVWKTDRQSLAVSLNLSPENLGDGQFHRTLEMMLRAFGTQELLIVEIPGSVLTSPEQLAGLRDMRERSVRVFIDDVIGPIDLADVPADGVKLGRSVVARLSVDNTALDEATTIVRAAKLLGRSVTAVGIEDERSWQILADIGCDAAQGFAIAAPMPNADLSRWRDRR